MHDSRVIIVVCNIKNILKMFEKMKDMCLYCETKLLFTIPRTTTSSRIFRRHYCESNSTKLLTVGAGGTCTIVQRWNFKITKL